MLNIGMLSVVKHINFIQLKVVHRGEPQVLIKIRKEDAFIFRINRLLWVDSSHSRTTAFGQKRLLSRL
ncbi:hypothetical protein DBV33_12180 [Pseudomonas fluorescens]|jgi:hypothetical protein|nr:hypothetical protein DBV33_12180 [Pseudomonas fluorescens]